jgi:hypothetical protein
MPIRARERSDAMCKLRYLSNYQILQIFKYSNTMQILEYRIRIPIADMEKEYNTLYNTRDCWWGSLSGSGAGKQFQGHSRGLRIGDGGTDECETVSELVSSRQRARGSLKRTAAGPAASRPMRLSCAKGPKQTRYISGVSFKIGWFLLSLMPIAIARGSGPGTQLTIRH